MLPDTDGLEVCRTLRATDSIPILMLTAKGDPMDRVVGLELGADDYLPKPFEPRELLARLKAILRRGKGEDRADIMRFGRLEIDTRTMEARVDGRLCELTAHQFKLLEIMAKSPGRVLSRGYLMDQSKGETWRPTTVPSTSIFRELGPRSRRTLNIPAACSRSGEPVMCLPGRRIERPSRCAI